MTSAGWAAIAIFPNATTMVTTKTGSLTTTTTGTIAADPNRSINTGTIDHTVTTASTPTAVARNTTIKVASGDRTTSIPDAGGLVAVIVVGVVLGVLAVAIVVTILV